MCYPSAFVINDFLIAFVANYTDSSIKNYIYFKYNINVEILKLIIM